MMVRVVHTCGAEEVHAWTRGLALPSTSQRLVSRADLKQNIGEDLQEFLHLEEGWPLMRLHRGIDFGGDKRAQFIVYTKVHICVGLA